MSDPDDPTARPDLVALIDLTAGQADDVCAAMENVGLDPVRSTLGTSADDTGIQRATVRIFIPRSQLRDARAVVQGVLPEYGGGPSAPQTLPSDEERAWADIVRELRADGVDENMPPPRPSPLEDDSGYQPPQPPPVPRPGRGAIFAWLLLVGGLVWAVAGVARESGRESVLVGIALFAIGFGALIWRLRDERDDFDSDDGAVV